MADGGTWSQSVTGIVIYLEGGGDKSGTKQKLRLGMSDFLSEIRDSCKDNRWYFKLVACGSRNDAYKKFNNFNEFKKYRVAVLLVDSEEKVEVKHPHKHLAQNDHWSFSEKNKNNVHLMVQTMEAWIVSDQNAMQKYYGNRFNPINLPAELEEVSKSDISNFLDKATSKTQKGRYHKIKHASDLLKLINPDEVRKRCRHCDNLFKSLLNQFEEDYTSLPK